MTALAASSAIAPVRVTPDRFNTVACLAVGAAIMGYCVAEPAPALAAFSMPVLALGWWLARGGTPTALPRAAINLLVVSAIARAFFSVAGSGNAVVSHLSEFLVLIQLIKLFDRKTPRDEAQVLCLSLFVVLGALLTDNGLSVGILVLIYTPLATAAAMLLQIRAGLTRAAAADAGVPRPARLAADLSRPGPRRGAARRQFGAVVATSVAMAFALAVVAFLITPRNIGADRLGRIQPRAGATIGFSDQVRLGQSGTLEQQSTPVMDVALTDGRGNDIGSEHRSLYLRGAVLTDYFRQQRLWGVRGDSLASRELPLDRGEQTHFAKPLNEKLVVRQDVSVRAATTTREAYLFALWCPVAVATPTDNEPVELTPEFTLKRKKGSPRFRYTVWSDPRGGAVVGEDPDPSPRPPVRESGPFRRPGSAIRALAERILAADRIPLDPARRTPPDVRAATSAFVNHLRDGFSYTLQMVAPPEGQDPIEWFLFERRAGHCEYFASAMVAMCQSVGIEARLVTGYLTTEHNPMTHQYVVRQSHAHAWAEVNIGGRWQTVDPSPPGAIEEGQRRARGLFGRLRQLYDAIDFAWNESVVSFDETRRSSLLSGLVKRLQADEGPLRRLQDLARRAARLLPAAATPAAGLVWLILVSGWALLTWLILPRLRRIRRARRPARATDPALRRLLAGAGFYDRALAALARAGLGKPDARPPLAHAAAITPSDPDSAAEFERLAELYYHVRFGGRPLSDDEAREAGGVLRSLADRLAARPRRRRRSP